MHWHSKSGLLTKIEKIEKKRSRRWTVSTLSRRSEGTLVKRELLTRAARWLGCCAARFLPRITDTSHFTFLASSALYARPMHATPDSVLLGLGRLPLVCASRKKYRPATLATPSCASRTLPLASAGKGEYLTSGRGGGRALKRPARTPRGDAVGSRSRAPRGARTDPSRFTRPPRPSAAPAAGPSAAGRPAPRRRRRRAAPRPPHTSLPYPTESPK